VDEARWLEVSMTVSGELGEAVAEVLDRYCSNGVVVETAVDFDESEQVAIPTGSVRVYGYMIIDEHIEDARRQLEEALWYLGRIQTLPKAAFKPIADEDWMTAWKQHYHPILVGEKLLILPAWLEANTDRVVVKIDPSMAFGTGTHPSTQLIMELLEVFIKPDSAVLDIGCGSGILSIAVLKLGAARAIGVDIDPASVKATKENAEANSVLAGVEVGLGSVREIAAGNFSRKTAPLVLANILAPVLVALLDDGMADLVEPGGMLLMAGILEEQAPRVIAAAEQHGLRLVEQRRNADWCAVAMAKD
jgi:ribosomal protein L11 methyltransferase